uniref:Transposase for insertion sequence element IS1328 n=1 Tax=Zeugodacus cucurbitae TaxID=28588 RepID=A0A0A1X3V0_ZEUCU
MLNYFLLCSCIVPTLLGAPIPVAQNDVISHIVIVTPQAQVHLEPAIKYDTSAFIHHLSPLARILSPHDDTILYVPANPAAPIIPVENISVGRANIKEQLQKLETKQWDQISQQIQQAVQTGSSQLGPQLSEAATAASSAAAAAGQGLFPALFPPGGSSSSNTASKEDKQTIESLLTSNARVYALTPAVSHVVDFVQSPLFIGPISAIRTRSIKESEITQSSAASELEAKKIDEIHFKDNVKTFDDAVKTQPQQERQRNLKVDPLEKNKELTENDNNEQSE